MQQYHLFTCFYFTSKSTKSKQIENVEFQNFLGKPVARGLKSFVSTCARSRFCLNLIPYVAQKFSRSNVDDLGATGGAT